MKDLLLGALSKAEDAEVYHIKVEKYPVHFKGNKLKSIKSSLSRGVSLRVKYKGHLGFSSDSKIDNRESIIERALDSAKYGSSCPFEFCKDPSVTPVDIFDPRTVSFDIEEAVDMGEKIIDFVLKKAPHTVNDLKITRYFIEVTYMAEGVEKTYYKTLVSRSLNSMQVTDDGFIYIEEWDSSCRLPADIYSIARRVVDKIPLTEKVFEMPSKPTTVIFHPKAADVLLRPITMGLSGSHLISGSSPLLGKFNRWIFDSRFSLADDPTIALASESEGFDGEGMPRRRNVLIDHGVLSGYLLDLKSACLLNFEPCGCANRGLDSPPIPSPSNLVVGEGDVPLEEMIVDVKEGILVEEVIGAGQSNMLAGEFSLNVSLGFKIEKGKIVGRVRNTMIAGNVYDLLKNNLVALSCERETYDNITAPYFMFRNLSVSGKG